MTDNNQIVYKARLHWIIFFWPLLILFLLILMAVCIDVYPFEVLVLFSMGFMLIWAGTMALTYHFSYLIIKQKHLILCSGILIRQTIDLPLNKIESIDVRQSIFGSIFGFGSLMITGTGGTQPSIHYIRKPLTCRRYIEQLMHA